MKGPDPDEEYQSIHQCHDLPLSVSNTSYKPRSRNSFAWAQKNTRGQILGFPILLKKRVCRSGPWGQCPGQESEFDTLNSNIPETQESWPQFWMFRGDWQMKDWLVPSKLCLSLTARRSSKTGAPGAPVFLISLHARLWSSHIAPIFFCQTQFRRHNQRAAGITVR